MPKKRCTAKLKSGELCGVPTLKGELCCLGHSKSKRAREAKLKGAKHPKSYVSTEELLKLLSKEIRIADKIADDEKRMRIKSSLAEKIIPLLDKVEDIKDLEKLLIKDEK